ncbi:MAG: hypothetical protein ACK4K8_00320 [Pannonibacter sp.]
MATETLIPAFPAPVPCIRDTLDVWLLDYVNNYLTVAKFAEHHGISEAVATHVLTVARQARWEAGEARS